jgi:hypothetical protein
MWHNHFGFAQHRGGSSARYAAHDDMRVAVRLVSTVTELSLSGERRADGQDGKAREA